MKTKIKRHSRSVLSVILAVCMLISCMTAAMIATDAANVDSDSVSAQDYLRGYSKENNLQDQEIYLTGDFNSWATNDGAWRLSPTNTNEYKGVYEVSGVSDFEFMFYTDSAYYGNGYEYKYNGYSGDNAGTDLPKSTANMKYTGLDRNKTYTFHVHVWLKWGDNNNSSVNIYCNEGKLTPYIHYGNNKDNFPKNTSVTNEAMTLKSGNVYTKTLPAGEYYFTIDDNIVNNAPSAASRIGSYSVGSGISINTEDYNYSNLKYRFYRLSAQSQMVLEYDKSTGALTVNPLVSTVTVQKSNPSDGISSAKVTAGSAVATLSLPADLPQGATATVKVKPTDSTKKVTTYTVNNESQNLTYNASTKLYEGTFTVPSESVTTVIIGSPTDKSSYAVDFSADPSAQGTVTAVDENGNILTPGGTVLEGTKVTFTASANEGYTFTGWSNGLTSKKSVETKTITAATTVVGNFGKEGYKFYKKTSLDGTATTSNMTSLSNGWYISEAIPNGTLFTIQRNADSQYVNAGGDVTYYTWTNSWCGPDKKDSVSSDWTATAPGTTATSYYQNNSGKELYFVYDPENDVVWTTTTSDGIYGITIFVKDGTVRNGFTTTDSWGQSTVSSNVNSYITQNHESDYYEGQVIKIEIPADKVRDFQNNIVITTTVDSAKQDSWYVKGFDVNGGLTQGVIEQEYNDNYNELSRENYHNKDAYDKIHTSHSNSFTLDLSEYPDDVIEITPIYFPIYQNSTNFIRFYAYDFTGDVKDAWDSRLAVYPYIQEEYTPYAYYPGQLMVNEGGVYYADIPATNSTTGHTTQGLTMNNYTWDDLHYNEFLKAKAEPQYNSDARRNYNRQTYDYSEFATINKIFHDPNHEDLIDEDIIFSFKYKGEKSLDDSNLGRSTYYNNSPSDKQNTALDYRTGYQTLDPDDAQWQWEKLTDYYYHPVDIFGQKVDVTGKETKAGYNPIRIVSNGYDYNATGDYATAWALYKPVNASREDAWKGDVDHYELFEVIGGQGLHTHQSESYLIDPDYAARIKLKYGDLTFHDQYVQDLYAKEGSGADIPQHIMDCERIPVMITYEYEGKSNKPNDSNLGSKDELGHRSDGRWYYSDPNRMIKAHTLIEVSQTKNNPSYSRDYYQTGNIDFESATGYEKTDNTGQTGITANFTNSNSIVYDGITFTNNSGETEAVALSNGKCSYDLTTAPDPDGNYTFEGWYLKNGDNYTLASREESFSVEAKTNDVYVARYYKTPAGNLNITHNLHPDSTGTANCYAKVEVMNGDNAVYTYDETTNPIKVTNTYMKSDSANTLRITLRTVPNTLTNLQGFYMKLDSEIESLAKKGVLDNVTVNINDPRAEATAVITTKAISQFFDSTTGEQKVKALPFYSKLEKPQYKYTIEYTYTSRLWGQQKYVQAGDITDDIVQYFNIAGDGSTGSLVASTKEAFLSMMAPYEDNFKEKIRWEFADATENWLSPELTIRVSATRPEDNKTFRNFYNLPYATSLGGNALTITAQKDNQNRPMKTTTGDQEFDATYGERYTLNNAGTSTQFLYAVPEINKGTKENPDIEYFQYWNVYTVDGSKLLRKCYFNEFNLTFYEAYRIVAVYGSSKTTPQEQSNKDAIGASITFLENSRNQWNHGYGQGTGAKENLPKSYWSYYGDRIFSDFVLSFSYNDLMISTTGSNVKTNLVIEQVAKLNKKAGSETEYDTTNLPTVTGDGVSDVETYIKTGNKNGHVYVKQEVNKAKIDNKNCIEYYYNFANVRQQSMTAQEYNAIMDTFEPTPTSNKNYLYRAYATITDGTDTVVSEPVYFTIYDMASIENYSQNAKANGGKS